VEADQSDRDQVRQIERQLALESENVDAAYLRIQELENDLARARRTLEVLEELVTEALDALDREP